MSQLLPLSSRGQKQNIFFVILILSGVPPLSHWSSCFCFAGIINIWYHQVTCLFINTRLHPIILLNMFHGEADDNLHATGSRRNENKTLGSMSDSWNLVYYKTTGSCHKRKSFKFLSVSQFQAGFIFIHIFHLTTGCKSLVKIERKYKTSFGLENDHRISKSACCNIVVIML